jgi:tRNA 2-thiouridine synthesizing protein A
VVNQSQQKRYFIRKARAMHSSINADRVLDLGEQGCGQLLMELLLAIRPLAEGQTLLVTALDPAAVGDIAAWCRMTGHSLLRTLPNNQFLVQKGSDSHAE